MLYNDAVWAKEHGGDVLAASERHVQAAYWKDNGGIYGRYLKAKDHVCDLKKTFDILRKYQIKLNPENCAFKVSSGSFWAS